MKIKDIKEEKPLKGGDIMDKYGELLKEEFKDNYLRINRVALILGISDHTIRRWYKWWESKEFEHPEGLELPPYYHMDRRGTKYFKKEDIPKLMEFKKKISTTHKGVMSEFNAAFQWGKRGEKILINKGTTSHEIKFKIK